MRMKRAHETVMTAITRLAILTVALVVLSSCANYRPVSSNRGLNGFPGAGLVVVLEKPFSFRPGLVVNTLPAGTYRPAFEDEDGIYFQAPTKVIIGDIVGSTLHDGGVYIKFAAATEPYYYVLIIRAGIFRLPEEFQFKLVRPSPQ